MRMLALLIALALAVVAMGALAGCPAKQDTAVAPPAPASPPANEPAVAKAPAAGVETASCPVLGTTMPKDKMLTYEYKGKTYYFCCPPCIDKFKADPEKWIKNPTPPKPPSEGM